MNHLQTFRGGLAYEVGDGRQMKFGRMFGVGRGLLDRTSLTFLL